MQVLVSTAHSQYYITLSYMYIVLILVEDTRKNASILDWNQLIHVHLLHLEKQIV